MNHYRGLARRVYFVRHGQCAFNEQGRIAGQLDPPLTELGFQQASSAAHVLEGSGARYLFSSDLTRARQTAEMIGNKLGLKVELDPDLREQYLGDMQGQLTRELHSLSSQAGESMNPTGAHMNTVRWGGGESIVDLYERLERFLDRLNQLPPGPAIVVSHGHAIHVADACIGGAGPLDIDWYDLPNGGIISRETPAPGRRTVG